jgi:hypothetical protein
MLFLGLSLGHQLRQARIERLESNILPSPNKTVPMKHLLAYVYSPLDEMQIWHSKNAIEHPEENQNPYSYS